MKSFCGLLSAAFLFATPAFAQTLLLPAANDPITAQSTADAVVAAQPFSAQPASPVEAAIVAPAAPESIAANRVEQPRVAASRAKTRAAAARQVKVADAMARSRRVILASTAYPTRGFGRGCENLTCPSFVLIGIGY